MGMNRSTSRRRNTAPSRNQLRSAGPPDRLACHKRAGGRHAIPRPVARRARRSRAFDRSSERSARRGAPTRIGKRHAAQLTRASGVRRGRPMPCVPPERRAPQAVGGKRCHFWGRAARRRSGEGIVLPRLRVLAMFWACVWARRCAGLTQARLWHVCATSIPGGIGPTQTTYAKRCASHVIVPTEN
jgi:hypothetical protein